VTPFQILTSGKMRPEQIHQIAVRQGIDPAIAAEHFADCQQDQVFRNCTYIVIVRECPAYMNAANYPGLMWLSIRRRDGEPVRSWPDLQEIKNAFLGEQGEAFEIFPAESRKVDAVNQYHLFGAPNMRCPAGFPESREQAA